MWIATEEARQPLLPLLEDEICRIGLEIPQGVLPRARPAESRPKSPTIASSSR
jgi:hypothetical protein